MRRDCRAAGIDYDGALMRFVQKREIYEKYLRKFLDDTHEAEALQAYRAQKLDEMQERVHALKGVSGTLGLVPLYQITAEIVQDSAHGEYAGSGKEGRPDAGRKPEDPGGDQGRMKLWSLFVQYSLPHGIPRSRASH